MSPTGEFIGELDIRYIKWPRRKWYWLWLPRPRTWIVQHPFTWCGPQDNPACYEIPAGFETDFASVPFLIRLVLNPMNGWFSDYGRAAAIHDLLYRRGATLTPPVSRAQADRVFYEAMSCEEVVWLTKSVMWLAVRLFGWTAYKKSV